MSVVTWRLKPGYPSPDCRQTAQSWDAWLGYQARWLILADVPPDGNIISILNVVCGRPLVPNGGLFLGAWSKGES